MRLHAGALAFLLTGVTSADDDKASAEALAEFRSVYDRPSSSVDSKVLAMRAVAEFRNPKVSAALAGCLKSTHAKVRIEAANQLAKFAGVKGTTGHLIGALGDQRNGGPQARGVRCALLRAFGALEAREAATLVDRFIQDEDVWVAKHAAETAGRLRIKSSVEILIKVLRRVDGRKGDCEVSLDLFNGELPPASRMDVVRTEAQAAKKKMEREILRQPILSALTSITRIRFSSSDQWQKWWRANKFRFVVP